MIHALQFLAEGHQSPDVLPVMTPLIAWAGANIVPILWSVIGVVSIGAAMKGNFAKVGTMVGIGLVGTFIFATAPGGELLDAVGGFADLVFPGGGK